MVHSIYRISLDVTDDFLLCFSFHCTAVSDKSTYSLMVWSHVSTGYWKRVLSVRFKPPTTAAWLIIAKTSFILGADQSKECEPSEENAVSV